MAIAIAISEGVRIPHVAGADISAGDVIVVGGDKALPATHDIANGETGSLAVEGLFSVSKEATTDTFAGGALVYWDDTAKLASTVNTNPLMGWAYEAAGATDTVVKIKLTQVTA